MEVGAMRGHPEPLSKLSESLRLHPHTTPTKNLSRGMWSPKKYASKKIIPSKNIKQISNKVLTIMKIYGKIDMQSKDCV